MPTTVSHHEPPQRSPAAQWAAGLLAACASLPLAIMLLAGLAILLAWATLVESRWGTPAAQFGIYGAWWFIALQALLGFNVLCAALSRLPWKRRHAGFLVTHLGILVLLAGCLLGYLRGVDAKLPIFEGGTAQRAVQDSQHLELKIAPADAAGTAADAESQSIQIPLVTGPFNWDDYQRLPWFPWHLARRSRGTVYDREGIALEVLDHDSDSRRLPLPEITVRIDDAPAAAGRPAHAEKPPARLTLAVAAGEGPHAAGRPLGMGERQQTPQGPWILFWMTGSPAETDAFLRGKPEGPLGKMGQVVFSAGDKTFRFPVDGWQPQQRHPLGETGFEVELAVADPRVLGLHFLVHHGSDPPQPMMLFAYLPHFNRQDDRHGIFGSYWFDPAAEPGGDETQSIADEALLDARRPRIDIIQGHDQRLYYRTWKAPEVETAGPWPGKGPEAANDLVLGTKIVAFERSEQPLSLTLEGFSPRPRPEWKVEAMPFQKDRGHGQQRRVRLRLRVDGTSEDFWLAGPPDDEPRGDQEKTITTPKRRVTVTMPDDALDLGFQVVLHKFQRQLDPGSSAAAHYSSLVDFLDARPGHQPLRQNVLIALNAPADVADPQTGRSYRLFQADFNGPWRPGDREFEQLAGKDSDRDELYLSWLSVNDDPGRGLKYAGSFLVIAGIAMVYYLRTGLSRIERLRSPLPPGEG